MGLRRLLVLVIVGILLTLGLSWRASRPVDQEGISSEALPVRCDMWVAYSFYPQTLRDLQQKASAVVVAQVAEVLQQPNQRIILDVLKNIRGDAGKQLRLWHYGTATTCQRGDPPYQVGERYLLFVLPMETEPGTHYVPAPPARYRVVNNQLEPMPEEIDLAPFAAAMRGKTLAEFEQMLSGDD